MIRRGRSFRRGACVGWLIGVAALACNVVACNRGHEMPGVSGSMSPWTDLKVPGMELFVRRGSGGYDAVPAQGAARIDGSRKVLTGKAAFDAARARVGNDPTALAKLAMLFLDEQVDGIVGGSPWTSHVSGMYPDEEALAHPPTLTGNTLEYWRRHSMAANLVRCRVALDSGKIDCEIATQVLKDQQMAADPYKVIDGELASRNVNDQAAGVADLAKIGDDTARKRLIDIALNADYPETRAAAADALGGLPGPGVVEALERVEKYDKSDDASGAATRALRKLKAGSGSRK